MQILFLRVSRDDFNVNAAGNSSRGGRFAGNTTDVRMCGLLESFYGNEAELDAHLLFGRVWVKV